MERAPAHQDVWNAPGLQRAYVSARDISAKITEAAEEDRNVAGPDRSEIAILLHGPATFVGQPVNECADRGGKGLVDLVFGEPAVIAVRAGNRQGDQRRPALDFRA